MTLQLLAKLALGGWFVYSIAAYGEGLRARGSYGLRTISFIFETAILTVCVWAGWFQ